MPARAGTTRSGRKPTCGPRGLSGKGRALSHRAGIRATAGRTFSPQGWQASFEARPRRLLSGMEANDVNGAPPGEEVRGEFDAIDPAVRPVGTPVAS